MTSGTDVIEITSNTKYCEEGLSKLVMFADTFPTCTHGGTWSREQVNLVCLTKSEYVMCSCDPTPLVVWTHDLRSVNKCVSIFYARISHYDEL